MQQIVIKITGAVVFILCLSYSGLAQVKKHESVPQLVKDSFTVRFPNTYVHDWEFKRKENLYVAEFKVNTDKKKAYFDANGNWKYSKKSIPNTMIPDSVLQHIKKSSYGSWKIDDADEYQSPENPTYYKIDVELQLSEVELYYLPDGTLINTVKKK